MAPTPKPEGARVRRNLGQKQWRSLERGAVPVPSMPGATQIPPELRSLARAYWRALWTDYGALYTDADRHPLARLCRLHAQAMIGKLGAQAQGELRQLEASFGSSPLGRARLQVQISTPQAPAGDEASAPVDLAAQRERRARIQMER